MLNTIVKNIAPEVLSAMTGKFGLNQEMGNRAVDTTKESLQEGVSNEISKGNLDGLLSMFNSGGAGEGNSTFQNLSSKLSGDYIQKLGLSPDLASQISHFVLPLVMNQISSMLGGKVDKESLTDALSTGGLMGKAGNLLGGLANIFKK